MRWKAGIGMLALSAGLALGQSPSNQAKIASGTQVDAQLKSKLDTQHAKVGDAVAAQTTAAIKEDGRTVLPKGTKLTGHVTSVTAAESKKSPSRIGVLFDQATLKNGATMPVHFAIASVVQARADAGMQAGMPAMDMPPPPQPVPDQGGEGGGMGGTGRVLAPIGGGMTVPGAVTGASPEIGAVMRETNQAQIAVSLPQPEVAGGSSASGAAAVGSVLSSSHGDLKLDAGTHVKLVAQGGTR